VGARGWTWLVVAVSFAGYLATLVWLRVRGAGAFYRPPGRVRPLGAGVAAASGWISAASFLSLGGALALSLPGGAVYLLGWTVGFALLALLVAPYLRRAGRDTIPRLVAERFGSPGAGALALACVLLINFTYLAAQLRGVAIVLARFAPASLPWAVAGAAAMVLVYTALGRLRTLTGGQVAQYLVLATAFLVVAGACLDQLTGNAAPQAALWARLGPGGAARLGLPAGLPLPAAVDRLGAGLGLPPLGAGVGSADLVATGLALVAGTAALPHMVSRFLAMPRAADASRSAGWALVFIVLFYSAVPALALSARAGLLAAPQGGWVAPWVAAGLAGEGAAAPAVAVAGARIDPDVLVLAAPELLGLPPWVIAVAAAGALAAAVSAAAALVVALGAGVARDLLRGSLAPGLSDRAERRVSQVTSGLLTLGAAWMALRPPGTVVQTVGLAFGLAAAALFPALVAGALWRRATRQGVVWGMTAGALFTVGYVHWFRFLHPELDDAAHWWLGISPQGIGAVGALLGAAVLVAVSLLGPAPATPPARRRP
jgi:cation/acetate symporter